MSTLCERFTGYVDTSGGPDSCHPFMGTRDRKGYGLLHETCPDGKRRNLLAHRLALIFAFGEPPDGQSCALHSCDNPPCCNIRHLRWGTKQENANDMVARCRSTAWDKHPNAKLTAQQVNYVRAELQSGKWGTAAKLARELGVSTSTISLIRLNRYWKVSDEENNLRSIRSPNRPTARQRRDASDGGQSIEGSGMG